MRTKENAISAVDSRRYTTHQLEDSQTKAAIYTSPEALRKKFVIRDHSTFAARIAFLINQKDSTQPECFSGGCFDFQKPRTLWMSYRNLPTAMSHRPAATAAAGPLLEPPGVWPCRKTRACFISPPPNARACALSRTLVKVCTACVSPPLAYIGREGPLPRL